MRDGVTLHLHEQTARRQGLMLRQLEFLMLRQQAYEVVLSGSSLFQRVRWVFLPGRLIATVEALHTRMLQESQKDLDKAQARARLKV